MGAAGIVYNADGKVLLLKRRNDSIHGGTWGLPAGGIEENETASQAALREFSEETGHDLHSLIDGNYGDPKPILERDDFATFSVSGRHFDPVLNDEHTDAIWCDLTSLPAPLHPGLIQQLRAVADACAMDYSEFTKPSAREVDMNGYVRIANNPITRAGVFQYSGRNLPGADPDKIYNVYRPLEELTSPEALQSFRGLPLIDEHEMLGEGYQRGAEQKIVHGWTGDDITVEGNDICVSLRIVSRELKRLIDGRKKGLSMGYRCQYEKSAGVWNGIAYDYIQTNIRGNHLALVIEGRVGTEVLDHHVAFDHFDLALDTRGEDVMADEKIEDKTTAEKKEPTIADAMAMIEKLTPLLELADKLKAGAADAEAAAALDAEEEEKKKAEDAEESKKEDEKKEKEAMDAAEIASLKSRLAKLEGSTSKEKNALVAEVTPLVGTFDHSAMDSAEVAAYACDKLKLNAPKGQEAAVLTGYLAGAKKNAVAYAAMDSKVTPAAGGKLATTLQARRA